MPLNDFGDYFEREFKNDLQVFLEAMPASQRKHYSKAPESHSIAMNFLVDSRMALKVVPFERRPLFAASLYFGALMDQAMHYHHGESYERYRVLTDYPKLTGACPGACMYMAEPTIALERTNLFNQPSDDYIQRHPQTLERNREALAPVLQAGRNYFRHAFPAFLRENFPKVAEPESFYRRVFDDWQEVEVIPALQAKPLPVQGGFHLAAGWGPVVEVRPDAPRGAIVMLTIVDGHGAKLELDFSATTGAFAGFRLQKHHLVGQRTRPKVAERVAGAPGQVSPMSSETVKSGAIICHKHMTAINEGDLLIDWSGRTDYALASSQPLTRHGVLHGYYIQDQLAAIGLSRIPITYFNEMPHFDRSGC
jgi:hypothetical protein